MTQGDASAGTRRVRTRDLTEMKRRGERIAALTCYDHLFARLLDPSGVEVVLVGDSLGEVVLGYESTLPVTVEQMIHHTAAVARGLEGPLLVADMPFMSFQVGTEDALRNAGRLMKEGSAEAVKVEGGDEATVERVEAMTSAGVPVMGHLGLTPQSVHRFGGYGLRGREPEEADRIRSGARSLEAAGCFALVLEMVPAPLAGEVTRSLEIPTIGIGAGPDCDGQILVLPDALGLNEGFEPRFLRRFARLGPEVRSAVEAYVDAVKSGDFPSDSESYAP